MMARTTNSTLWIICACVVGFIIPSIATAGEVTLRSHDQSISVRGDLVSFDGVTYFLNGDLGEVEISASMVTCIGIDCPVLLDEAKLSIVGSDVLGVGLLPVLMEYFSMKYDIALIQQLSNHAEKPTFILGEVAGVNDIEISVSLTESTIAYEEVLNRSASFGMVSWTPNYDFTSSSNSGELTGITSKLIGINAIAVLVSQDNPIDVLTMAQIAGIFSGEITNWAEVGGQDGEISVYALEPSSNSAQLFSDRILVPENAVVTSEAQIFDTGSDISRAIIQDLNAIGFASLALSEGAKVLSLRGECGIVFSPTKFSIQTEEYPLTEQLYMVKSRHAQTAAGDALWTFLDSETAQVAVEYAGFVNSRVSTESFSQNGERLISLILAGQEIAPVSKIREFANDLRYAQRLSTALRFDYNNDELDLRTEQQISQLASYIMENYGPNQEVIVAGFTSTKGMATFNTAHSLKAAQLVQNNLAEDLSDVPISIISKGYGNVSPLNCGATAHEENMNQHIEIWIRDIT